MAPPFFVIGAPRSGTTFLVQVLDRHPEIFLTNETRVFTYLNRILRLGRRDSFMLQQKRETWLDVLEEHLPRVVEAFYQRLGVEGDQRWGDKFPHYADPKMDPECLDLIDRLFPESQFVHIYRDGRDVVASLVRKGWNDLEGSCDVWRRHLFHARRFGYSLGLSRYLEIRYEDMVADPQRVTSELWRFLRISESEQVEKFLAEQERSRTPFSKPMSAEEALGQSSSWTEKFSARELEIVESLVGDALVEFGYEPPGYLVRSLMNP